MHNPLVRLRGWWRPHPDFEPGVRYAVTCACGVALSGVRRRERQVLPCPACGRSVFVLPYETFSIAGNGKEAGPVRDAPPRHPPALAGWRAWRAPLVAAGLTTGLLVALSLALLPRLQRVGPSDESVPAGERLRQRIESGRRKLADGQFRGALDDLDAALRISELHPERLAPEEARRVRQLHRQGDLLAHLLKPSLEEILQQALQVRHEGEWQGRFNDDYRGKAVVFDDAVRRDADGSLSPQVYEVRAGRETARVALDGLELFGDLPPDPPPRLLFGARLAGLSRERGGRWVFRFQPDSGVLLTDPGAVAACGLAPLDAELLEVLRRQEEWLSR